jgi:hypothetical protein
MAQEDYGTRAGGLLGTSMVDEVDMMSVSWLFYGSGVCKCTERQNTRHKWNQTISSIILRVCRMMALTKNYESIHTKGGACLI